MKIIIDSETSEVQIDQDVYHAIPMDWDTKEDICSQCAINQVTNGGGVIYEVVCGFCNFLHDCVFVNNNTLVLTKEQIAEKLGIAPENLIIKD